MAGLTTRRYDAWIEPAEDEFDKDTVYWRHTCRNGDLVHHSVSWLPTGPDGWRLEGDRIRPSVHCLSCGFHQFLTLGPRPADPWTPWPDPGAVS